MKILVFCPETDRIQGGRGEHVLKVNAGLTKLGHDVTHVHFDDWIQAPNWKTTKAKEPCWTDVTGNPVATHLTNSWLVFEHSLQLPRPDVVVAHDWDQQEIAFRVARHFGVPYVAIFHLFQHQMLFVEGRKHSEELMLTLSLERNALMRADKVIVVSESMRKWAIEQMGCEKEIDVVYNGVDAHEWTTPSDAYSLRPHVLYMGRIAQQKGWDLICDLADRTDKYEIRFVGKHACLDDKARANSTEVKRLIECENKNPHFLYWGHTYSQQQRCAHYNWADVVIMPSRAEPFGIVALEAMASARPLVTTRVDGLAEFCNDKNSYLCEASVVSLQKTIKQALSGGLRGGEAETVRKFSWQKTIIEMERRLYAAQRSLGRPHTLRAEPALHHR